MLFLVTVLISVILSVTLIIRDPWIQNLAVKLAADYLSREMGITVRIGSLDLSVRNGLLIGDILVRDHRDTTLLAAHQLAVKPLWVSLQGRNIIFQKVFISKGEFQLVMHRGDSILNVMNIVNHFASRDTIPKPPDTAAPLPWSITCNHLELDSFRFHYQDQNNPLVPVGMDYTNIDVRDISLDITGAKVIGDSISATVNRLTARERSGIYLHEFRGDCRVCSHSIVVDDLNLTTDNSTLSLDFAFRYDGFIAFTDFLKRVTIEAQIRPSVFDMTDIGYFAPEVASMKNRFKLQGDLAGTVSKFRARNFLVDFGESTRFDGNIYAIGLPDVMATYVDMTINQFTSTAADIGSFKLPGDPGAIEIPKLIANLGLITVKGDFTGFVDDFISRADIGTDIGNLSTNIQISKQTKGGPLAYKGELTMRAFDVGRLLDEKDLLGKVTLQANIDGQGTSFNSADVAMQVHVDSAQFNGYNYHDLTVNGSLAGEKFLGQIIVDDPNLRFSFNGMANFRDSLPDFNFNAKISYAQLFNLHLLERDSVEVFSVDVDADLSGSNVDNIDGHLTLRNLSYWEGRNRALIDSLLLNTEDSLGQKVYKIRSDLLDANFSGQFQFSKLIPSLVIFIQNYLVSFNKGPDTAIQYYYSGQDLTYMVQFKNTEDVTAIFLPFLKVSPGTFLEGNYSEEKRLLSLSGRSSLLNVYGFELEKWFIDAETHRDDLSINTGCSRLVMNRSKPTDTIYVQIDTLLLSASVRHDSILYKLSSDSKESYSFLEGFLTFLDDGSVKIKLEDMDLKLAGKPWTISKENFLILDTALVEFHDIRLLSGDQWLSLNGRMTHHVNDTVDLNFNGVNVSQLDYFFANPNIDIDGILSGNLKFTDVFNEISIYSNLKLDDFSFNKQHLGDAVFKVNYNKTEDKFDVVSEIIYTGNIGQSIPFSLTGSLFTGTKNPYFDFDLKLKNLNLKMIEPFVSSFMSKLTGLASGEVKITGTFQEPSFEGEIKLMRTELNISYLNVPYSVADVISVTPDKLLFNNMVLYDSLGNKAYLNGSINHDYFRNLTLNLHVRMDDFSAFRNTYAQNSTFYGHARASGTVDITGPIENISIGVRASTGSNTSVTIPINLTQSVGQIDYIVFVQPKEDSLAEIQRTSPNSPTGLNLSMNLNVNPDAQVEVIFPDQLGNIKATGSGSLTLGMTPTVPFNLHGRYFINKGSFLFHMKNLIRMSFAIKEGSSIAWTGDPTDADISLAAVYKTKVPLTGLSSVTSSIQGRIPVECIIRLNGKLMNPIMSFGLALPNAQESERNMVFNAIDTNNTSEMTQQVLYILVMNQFKPVAGGSDPTVDVGSTSLSIVTNQINSWLSGMSQNLNIGVSYKPGSSTVSQELDMTVSTQLFNDRLLIDGTFGMSSYKNTASAQASTIVGDINVEYILTKNRRWRIRAFNRTNTIDILNNNAPYTQGVGLSYQRDFYTWTELFKRSKPKRQ